MAVSPFVDFEQYLYAAPFNSAPGKARVLWDALSHEHPLVLVDRPGFWFSAFEKHVEMSYASVEALWFAAYCYTLLYQERIAQQCQSEFQAIILQNEAGRSAIDHYRWSLLRLHRERDEDWPANAPSPTMAEADSIERHATEFFLVAFAWVLHHELGHLLLQRPIDPKIPTKEREWQADTHATQWLFDGAADPLVRRKLFVGVTIALGFLGARKPPTQDSDTHPPPYDRLDKMLQAATQVDEEPAYAFALNALLTNWTIGGHETWIQASNGTFKELFVEFGRALRNEEQETWARIDAQMGFLYEGFVRGPLTEDDQRKLAYALWEDRGRPLGSPERDWYMAAEILRYCRWNLFLTETTKQ
ncbi:MAG TPA: phage exclusion protein Lit family protein [Bryobacteraceae bacterium]|nr:phage exclusion protein Lit family protein [Bryobacteraceae bacterium]